MLRSMTGFGAGSARVGAEELEAELRSVNGRFCEVKVRLPRELAALEAELARTVKERVARGTIEVSIRRAGGEVAALQPKVNRALAALYAEQFKALTRALDLPGEVSLTQLLAADGVVSLEARTPDTTDAGKAAGEALGHALDALLDARAREGEALGRDLAGRLEALQSLGGRIREELPRAQAALAERLTRRVRELGVELALDPARLAQEVALLAERSDVAEELTRLDTHLAEVRRLLGEGGPCGRRLDFLVQELNREINTTGSKSQWAGISAAIVEMKVELERFREQVQNVE